MALPNNFPDYARMNRPHDRASCKPTTKELYWAAGFIEGEGTFAKPEGGSPRVLVSQKQREPLERLHRWFGGRIYCLRPRRDIYLWAVNGTRARGVAMTLYTILSPKRRSQVESILDLDSR